MQVETIDFDDGYLWIKYYKWHEQKAAFLLTEAVYSTPFNEFIKTLQMSDGCTGKARSGVTFKNYE